MTIRFDYQPTLKEWSTLNLRFALRQLRVLVFVAGLMMALYVAGPFIRPPSVQGPAGLEFYAKGLPILIIPGLVALIFMLTYISCRRRWEAAEELRLEKEYEIDETGVRVTTTSSAGFLEWRHFVSAEVIGGLFVLRTAQTSIHYFPVAVVSDELALRELLAVKIPAATRSPRRTQRWIIFAIWLAILGIALVLSRTSR